MGCVLLNKQMTRTLLVKGWGASSPWGFPKGKMNAEEPDLDCAVREVLEDARAAVRVARAQLRRVVEQLVADRARELLVDAVEPRRELGREPLPDASRERAFAAHGLRPAGHVGRSIRSYQPFFTSGMNS